MTASQLVVPSAEHCGFIHRYHDSIFAGHFGVPGLFAGYLIECIGPDFVRTFVPSIDSDGRLCCCRTPPVTASQLVVPSAEHCGFIHRYHDSIFAGHFDVPGLFAASSVSGLLSTL